MNFYTPEEDSHMAKLVLENHLPGKRINNSLEIGCSGGYLSKTILRYSNNHVAVDINPYALTEARSFLRKYLNKKNKHVEIINSDLFENVPPKKYDIIMFNPPYLPAQKNDPDKGPEGWITKAIVGGKKGYEIILRFLEDLPNFLAEDGKCYLVFSSLSKQDIILEAITNKLCGYHLLDHKKIMGEDLFLYEIFKSPLLINLEKKGITNIKFFKKGKRGKVFTAEKKVTEKEKCRIKKIGIKLLYNFDAKNSIEKEIKNLKYVNKFNVGPKFLEGEKNYVIYEFVDGIPIVDFYETFKKDEIKEIILQTIDQCRLMDKNQFEKKEMTNPYKHIIIKRISGKNLTKKIKVVLIDFERGVKKKRCKNVTQFLEYLTKSKFAHKLNEKGIFFEDFKELAKDYILNNNDGTYLEIIKSIKKSFT